MWSAASLEDINRTATYHARRAHRQPMTFTEADLASWRALPRERGGAVMLGHIPYVGYQNPKGWRRVDIATLPKPEGVGSWSGYMPDAWGQGAYFIGGATSDGRSMGGDQLLAIAQPGLGYGRIEDGPFQNHVAVWRRIKPRSPKVIAAADKAEQVALREVQQRRED